MILCGNECERGGFLHKLLDAFDPLFCFSARDKVAQALNDLPGPNGLLGSLVHRLHDHWCPLVGAVLQQPSRPLEVVRDGRKRLVELVGKCGRHLAHGAEPRDVKELRLHLMEQPLTLLTLGQVTHEADELPLPFLLDLAHRKLHRECAAVLSLADDDAPTPMIRPLAGGQISIQVAVMFVPVRRRASAC